MTETVHRDSFPPVRGTRESRNNLPSLPRWQKGDNIGRGNHPARKAFNQRQGGVYRRGNLPTYTWSNRIEWDKNRSSPIQYEWPPPHQSPSCFPDRISCLDRSLEVNLQVISSEREQRLDRVWPSSVHCTRKEEKKLPGNRLVFRQGKGEHKIRVIRVSAFIIHVCDP